MPLGLILAIASGSLLLIIALLYLFYKRNHVTICKSYVTVSYDQYCSLMCHYDVSAEPQLVPDDLPLSNKIGLMDMVMSQGMLLLCFSESS